MPVEQHSDPFEDRLGAALRQVGGSFDPHHLAALTAAGQARGRRLRLRRRAAIVGSTAGLALVGVGGALLSLPGDGSPDREQRSVATAPTATAGPTATPEKPRPSAPEKSVPVSVDGDTIGQTLAGLLPDGLEVVARGAQEAEFAYLVVDDGKGRSLVQINVQPGMSDVAGQLFGADAETLPSGTKVTTSQRPGEKGGAGVVMWTADTIRTDGLRVVVSAFNSGAQDTAATRETPALTMEQLKEIAVSPKWLALR
ncbi:hypothetical protein [Streptomyces sp. NL15-2K]|uniref:hypothetical protein n=1 Tax=Streptomyces sp. NL15-2K TaxID=376149 RepID=UPI000F57F1C3|nr:MULTISPECIES: hypothetical protein [Actinomycetes]WKX12137.1 hypothetical protein Q4V64_33325 [Kutzneria buriramensis]GCB46370.1 hypothetical protein SNL152K_3668 [Streptomyces sp. NL15-2K]